MHVHRDIVARVEVLMDQRLNHELDVAHIRVRLEHVDRSLEGSLHWANENSYEVQIRQFMGILRALENTDRMQIRVH